jgi:hypothetical protein
MSSELKTSQTRTQNVNQVIPRGIRRVYRMLLSHPVVTHRDSSPENLKSFEDILNTFSYKKNATPEETEQYRKYSMARRTLLELSKFNKSANNDNSQSEFINFIIGSQWLRPLVLMLDAQTIMNYFNKSAFIAWDKENERFVVSKFIHNHNKNPNGEARVILKNETRNAVQRTESTTNGKKTYPSYSAIVKRPPQQVSAPKPTSIKTSNHFDSLVDKVNVIDCDVVEQEMQTFGSEQKQ